METKKLLLVEDDKGIAMGLEYSLRQEGFETVVCTAVRPALERLQTERFDLAILDLSLPDGTGYDVCRAIKAKNDGAAVIFLTARDDEGNIVMGLDMGADDYITPPCRLRELVSRSRSVRRRGGRTEAGNVYTFGSVQINTAQGKVYKEGRDVFLTALEYRLLLSLVNNEGRILSRNQLLESIWDVSGDFVNDNTLTVYIKRLREKIEDDPQNPVIIQTVRGLGYRIGKGECPMTFFRSQEVQRLCVLLGLTTAVAAAAGFCRDVWTGLAALGGSLAVAAVALLFTAWRYREMEKLAANLRRIAGGDYSLDVRDNEEGELSILKSELYKVTAMLSEYNERLRQEKVSLSDSMADISHQLKTPLTSMLMMADLLQDSELPEEKRREFTGRLRAQLERIEWLVSSLLKLSKLDAGVAVMKKDPVNVRSLVEKAVSPLLIPMELKEQTLELEGGEGVYFIGDAHWTTEALINILKNCMEHTPCGGRLQVTWEGNPIYTQIRIADTGEGIPKEDLPHIFTRFYRGRNAHEDSVGIGLAMAKSIILQQNGDITADSYPGRGTTFSIRFYKTVV